MVVDSPECVAAYRVAGERADCSGHHARSEVAQRAHHGLFAGVALSAALALLVPALPAEVSVFWTATALFLSLLVGLFFGIYPAMKAAGLDPVRSLRYE